jgi:hypothetical protein
MIIPNFAFIKQSKRGDWIPFEFPGKKFKISNWICHSIARLRVIL